MIEAPAERFVTVNHVVFPTRDVAEVSSLYVDTGAGNGSQPGETYEFRGRRAVEVYPHKRLSLGSFFNAFPASYWQRFSDIRQVRLAARLEGKGLISVYKSSARGRASAIASRAFEDETIQFDLPLTSFIDGGYYWFDIACADARATLVSADWSVPAKAGWSAGTATIGITTFNRPTYCLDQLLTVGASDEVSEVIDRLIVVDQGTQLVEDLPGYPDAVERLGGRLAMIHQANLGGSGGFGRAMLETLASNTSQYVLLLDDDAISEPEAIFRAVRFGDFASRPTIVGGGMLHLDERAVLYTRGERWNYRKSWMEPAGESQYDNDFAEDTLRETPELHRRISADFNGWWMCLIPTVILRDIGLSLPVFLKFDDIEYSLRAGGRGYSTVCLPGVAVWHMAWHDKDPSRTWEEYFVHRNRWITGLLHPGGRRGAFLPLHSFLSDIKFLFMLQYSTVRLRHEALCDVLRGPDLLPEMLGNKQGAVRELRAKYVDAQIVEDLAQLPSVRRPLARLGREIRRPTNFFATASLAFRVTARQLLVQETVSSRANPERILAASDLRWWRFADIDSALVTSPDGVGMAWYRRDRRLMRRFLARSLELHLQLLARWPRLSRRYQAAVSELTSPQSWERVFGNTP